MDTKSDESVPESGASSPMSDLPTSDSEACNTASSRVHFGPLRSPEKLFISRRQTARPTALNSPHRRSTRISMPANASSPHTSLQDPLDDGNESDAEEYNLDQLRVETPDSHHFPPDEPSSALATRIIRAHDNPSPPPSTHEDQEAPTFLIHSPAMPCVDVSRSSSPPPPSTTVPNPQNGIFLSPIQSPSFKKEPQASPGHDVFDSPSLLPGSRINPSPKDLISFDSFSAPPEALPNPDRHLFAELPVFSPQMHSRNECPPSIDDLLFHSPSPPPHHSVRLEIPPPGSSSPSPILTLPPSYNDDGNRKGTGESLTDKEEHDVADMLVHKNAESRPESSKLPTIVFPVTPRCDDGEQQHTPLRRSTRPRRSVSPYTGISVEDERSTPIQHRSLVPSSSQHPFLAPPSSVRPRRKNVKDFYINEMALSSPSQRRDTGEDSIASGLLTDSIADVTRDRDKDSLDKKGKRRDDDEVERNRMTDEETIIRGLGSLSSSSTNLIAQPEPANNSSSPLALLYPHPLDKRPGRDHSSNLMRNMSPVGYVAQRSTPRSRPVDDNRTPARRIPIEQAVAQGHISPQKAEQLMKHNHGSGTGMGVGSSVLRTPVFSVPDPGRRVPTSSERTQGARVKSTVRATSGTMSVDHQPQGFGSGKGKGVIVEEREVPPSKAIHRKDGSSVQLESSSSLAPPPITGPKLPFPLAPAHEFPKSEVVATSSTAGRASGPQKSSLRQHSSGSRIPRIGIKPYARPGASTASGTGQTNQRKMPTVMRRVDLAPKNDTAKAPKPFRMVQMESGSSSDDVIGHSSMAGYSGSDNETQSAQTVTSTYLKRKRGAEQNSLFEKGSSVPMRRQMGPSQAKTPHSSTAITSAGPSSGKKVQPLTIRRVADRVLSDRQDKESPGQHVRTAKVVEGTGSTVKKGKPTESERSTPAAEDADATLPSSSPSCDAPSRISGDMLSQPPKSGSIRPGNDSDQPGEFRRTTRVQRAAQSSTGVDVFGPVHVRPLQARRRAHLSTRVDTDVFSGMSAVALRALTSSNTAKNQKYVAAKLETEVVRKEGMRPDSPAVKMKTILQRQEEERERQKKERADRRARRSEDGPEVVEPQGPGDRGDLTVLDMDDHCNGEGLEGSSSADLQKHQRGPGDQEDYETPDKPPKRTRLDEDDDMAVEKKRVKWDRGLSTMIYLEDVQPRGRARPKEIPIKKGCLAKTAKALRLDMLGNHPNAETPLADLVHENIVVKKFVYDNELVPPGKIVVLKGTRSRGKKSKH